MCVQECNLRGTIVQLTVIGPLSFVSGDLVLAKISEEMADAKKEYFENKTQMQTEAVDNDLLKEQNPSMPITQRRNSSVSYGKKKGAE